MCCLSFFFVSKSDGLHPNSEKQSSCRRKRLTVPPFLAQCLTSKKWFFGGRLVCHVQYVDSQAPQVTGCPLTVADEALKLTLEARRARLWLWCPSQLVEKVVPKWNPGDQDSQPRTHLAILLRKGPILEEATRSDRTLLGWRPSLVGWRPRLVTRSYERHKDASVTVGSSPKTRPSASRPRLPGTGEAPDSSGELSVEAFLFRRVDGSVEER